MYTMVLMMAVAGSTDTAGFGGHRRGASCNGAVVSYGCTGYAAPVSYGCSGYAYSGCYGSSCYGTVAAGCNGNDRGGFLGLRDRGGFLGKRDRNGCHGSTWSCHGGYVTGCYGSSCYGAGYGHGCTGYAAPAHCCGWAAPVVSTGCTGAVVVGGAAPVTMPPATTTGETKGTTDTKKKSD